MNALAPSYAFQVMTTTMRSPAGVKMMPASWATPSRLPVLCATTVCFGSAAGSRSLIVWRCRCARQPREHACRCRSRNKLPPGEKPEEGTDGARCRDRVARAVERDVEIGHPGARRLGTDGVSPH